MWFALQDFAAEPGWTGGNPYPDPPFVQKGEIDINGNPRQPLFSTIQSIYRSTVQIAPAVTAAYQSRKNRRARQRSNVAMTRKPSTAVSFLPSAVARAR